MMHLAEDVLLEAKRRRSDTKVWIPSDTAQQQPPGDDHDSIKHKPVAAVCSPLERLRGNTCRISEDQVCLTVFGCIPAIAGKAGEDWAADSQLQDQMAALDVADAAGQQASSAEIVTTDEYDSGSWTGDDGTERGRFFEPLAAIHQTQLYALRIQPCHFSMWHVSTRLCKH